MSLTPACSMTQNLEGFCLSCILGFVNKLLLRTGLQPSLESSALHRIINSMQTNNQPCELMYTLRQYKT